MPTLPKPGDSFEQAPEGTHLAVCTGIVDLGTQHEEYQGKARDVHQMMIMWELVDEAMSNGERFGVMRSYTWSVHEKAALRKDLEAWRGAAFKESDFGDGGFEIKNVLGKSCLVMVGRTSTDKAKVVGVAAKPKGMPSPTPSREPIYLWLSPEEFSEEHFDALSDFWKGKVKASPEYLLITAPKPRTPNGGSQKFSPDLDDEIPF